MTENEAIEELKYDCNELGKAIPCDTSWGKSFENAYAMAINALEEIEQYRTIGTVEECQKAMTVRRAVQEIVDPAAPGSVHRYYRSPHCRRWHNLPRPGDVS